MPVEMSWERYTAWCTEKLKTQVARNWDAIPQPVKAIQLASNCRADSKAIISIDPVERCWRVSWFDQYGAWSHQTFPKHGLFDVVRTMLGVWVDGIGCPYGGSEWYVEQSV